LNSTIQDQYLDIDKKCQEVNILMNKQDNYDQKIIDLKDEVKNLDVKDKLSEKETVELNNHLHEMRKNYSELQIAY